MIKKALSKLKEWHGDKSLPVLSGKEVFSVLLTFSICGLFVTALSIRNSIQQEKWDQKQEKRHQERREAAQRQDQYIKKLMEGNRELREKLDQLEKLLKKQAAPEPLAEPPETRVFLRKGSFERAGFTVPCSCSDSPPIA